jgi:epoxyqueuosine reductase
MVIMGGNMSDTAATFGADPAGFIRRDIVEYTRGSPDNRLAFMDNYVMWEDPLVAFADGDDPLFTQYKTVISPEHMTPREALAKALNKSPEELPSRLSVISWILPAVEETRKSNRPETRTPSRLWSHTRWYGERFNRKLATHVVELLTGKGYLAAAPGLQPYFKMLKKEDGPYSNWSERHVAFAAGHGTFSLSDGFISEKGIAIRCASVVTSLELPATPRAATGPYSNCLFYAGVNCRACMERCPAGAISEKGHDKFKCDKYLADLGYAPTKPYDNETSVAGCGLCQTKVPCEFQNPVARIGRKGTK